MSQADTSLEDHKPLVLTRSVEVATALVIALFGLLVAWDSQRVGAAWGDQGPEAGFFPFYIGIFLVLSGLGTVVYAFFSDAGKKVAHEPFVRRGQLKAVLRVFIPTTVYVILMQFIGLYAAMAIYIAAFMMINGGYSVLKALPFAAVVPVIVFVMFEIWFLVPLPKGPIEAMLGY